MTTVNLFYCLLWGSRTLNTYTIGCLFHLLPFCKQLTSKNINGNLFVASFSVNKLCPAVCMVFNLNMHLWYLPFYSFHSKYTNHTLFLRLLPLGTSDLTLSVPFGLQNITNTFLLTLKRVNMLRGTFFVIFFLLHTLLLLCFAVELVVASAAPVLLHFNLQKNHWYFAFSILTTVGFWDCWFGSFKR